MKANYIMGLTVGNTPISKSAATISDIEQVVERGLEALRSAPLNEQITSAFQYLIPDGLRPKVQLEEDGRKKRSTASASNWNPQTGSILIYFEPDTSAASSSAKLKAPPNDERQGLSMPLAAVPSSPGTDTQAAPDEVTPLHIQQCCVALAEAEKAGKAFIALKWFRDESLPNSMFEWTTSTESRQAVLAKAIESGAIKTTRIPNPKSPQHPTTTVALNHAKAPEATASRFRPIAVRGEPVSVSMMRDRGSL